MSFYGPHSPEALKKISEASIKNNTGRKFTAEHRASLSKARLGKKETEEHKKNISKALLGHSGYWKNKMRSAKDNDTIRNAINIHHIDLNKKNNLASNLLPLSCSKHKQLHARAYDYVVSMGLINEYLKWFDEHFKLEIKKEIASAKA